MRVRRHEKIANEAADPSREARPHDPKSVLDAALVVVAARQCGPAAMSMPDEGTREPFAGRVLVVN